MNNVNQSSRVGNPNDVDVFEIQRMVDGRLLPDEVDCFIAWVDEADGYHPDVNGVDGDIVASNWRAVAMSFIEEQSLRRAYEESSRPPESMSASKSGMARAERLATLALALAAGLLIAAVSFSLGSRSAPNGVALSQSEPDVARDTMTADLGPQDQLADGKAVETLQYLTAAVSEPLIGREATQMLAENGVISIEEPVIYVIEDQYGNSYVVPNREAFLISHQP
ncbi:MAG: hypothetical protein AAF802_31085 [Planctomycetota bacterium]